MPPPPTSTTFERLRVASRQELTERFETGTTPTVEHLAGWEFRGLHHSAFPGLLGSRKFIKGFYMNGDTPCGYNVAVRQRHAGWRHKGAEPTPFGFYRLRDSGSINAIHPHALVLDYDGMNPRLSPTRRLRDYLVAIDDDTYVGVTYYSLGRRRIRLPTLFILDRFAKAIRGVTSS